MHENRNKHVNALEFIGSWDKNWTELNKLDFFIYRIINLLVEELNNTLRFESKVQQDNLRALGFLLGDKLESFLTSFCFSDCPLKCPISFNKSISHSIPAMNKIQLKDILNNISGLMDKNSKVEFWKKDIQRFVARETVMDYLRFSDSEILLPSLSSIRDLIKNSTDLIFSFSISDEGQHYLQHRSEPASKEFSKALKEHDFDQFGHVDGLDKDQMDFLLNELLDNSTDEDELENWQLSLLQLDESITEHLLDDEYWFAKQDNAALVERQEDLILFSDFLTEFSWISSIEDIDVSILHEFIHFYLPFYFNTEEYGEIIRIQNSLVDFFNWLILNDYKLINNVIDALRKSSVFIQRLTSISKAFDLDEETLSRFQEKSNFVTYHNFYRVISRNLSSLILKNANLPFLVEVNVPEKSGKLFRKDDILDAVLIKEDNRRFSIWQVFHIYPGKAQIYLFGDIDAE